jgi:hypothetical protein
VLPQWVDLDGASSVPLTTQQVRLKLEAANQQAKSKPGGVEATPLRYILFLHLARTAILQAFRFEVKYKDCVPISFTDMPGLR